MKRLALCVFVLMSATSDLYADCGCEGESFIHVTYIERHTGELKDYFATDHGMMAYSSSRNTKYSDVLAGELMQKYSSSEEMQNTITEGVSYKLHEGIKTAPLLDENGVPHTFYFRGAQRGELNYLTVREIISVEMLGVGCGAIPPKLSDENFNAIKNGATTKGSVRERIDENSLPDHQWSYYEIKFTHNDKEHTLRHDIFPGCY